MRVCDKKLTNKGVLAVMRHKLSVVLPVAAMLLLGTRVKAEDGRRGDEEDRNRDRRDLSGTIFTTTATGAVVSGNQFESKCAVYLDGGPGPHAPALPLPAYRY